MIVHSFELKLVKWAYTRCHVKNNVPSETCASTYGCSIAFIHDNVELEMQATIS